MALADLVNDYSPIFYFHRDEKYFPTTPDHYLENSNLLDGDDVLVKSAPITQADLYAYADTGSREYKLELQDNDIINDEFNRNVPIYAYTKEENNKIYVTYLIFYSYSGPVNILGMEAGAHYADIEHVTLEFNTNHDLLRVYFAAHGYEEGQWVDANDISKSFNHPVIYVANSTHANYSKRGLIFRYLGFGNDETGRWFNRWSPDVIHVKERNAVDFDINNSWIYYPGTWTTSGISGVVSQRWYDEIEVNSVDHEYVRERELESKQLQALIAAVLDGSIFDLLALLQ